MKPKVFIARKIPEEGLEILKKVADIKVWQGELPPPRDVLLNEVEEVDGLIPLLAEKVDKELMDKAKHLKIISNYAVGFDNIDVSEATRRGLMVTNTPDVLTDTTADLAFALLLAAARRVAEGDRFVRAGKWTTWGPMLLLGKDVHGATLGLIGLGRIGWAMAKRARGFDMKVLYYNRTRKEQAEKELGIEYVELKTLLKESDFVSLHVPLNKETKHLINKETLGMMKNTSMLVNTTRGPVVDEAALYQALVNKEIAGAALDVMDPEPPQGHSPLFDLDNVVIVPHIGSASEATRAKMAVMAATNMVAGLKGEVPQHLVNKEVLRLESGQ